MSVYDRINRILDAGKYIPSAEDHYRVGGRMDAGLDASKKIEADPIRCDLKQAGWPAEMTSQDYKQSADDLWDHYRENLGTHILIGEMLRAVDCRLTEILYFMGFYPEEDWVVDEKQLSVTKKLQMAAKLLPKEIWQPTLLRQLADTRNEAEHRYAEPSKKDLRLAKEAMKALFKSTEKMLRVIQEFSMFCYEVDKEQRFYVQIMRRDARVAVLKDGEEMPPPKMFLPPMNPKARELIHRILCDIQDHIDDDPDYFKKLGYSY